jgi:hypothetical protein
LGLQPVLVALEQLPLLERLQEPSELVAMSIRRKVLRSHRLVHIRRIAIRSHRLVHIRHIRRKMIRSHRLVHIRRKTIRNRCRNRCRIRHSYRNHDCSSGSFCPSGCRTICPAIRCHSSFSFGKDRSRCRNKQFRSHTMVLSNRHRQVLRNHTMVLRSHRQVLRSNRCRIRHSYRNHDHSSSSSSCL